MPSGFSSNCQSARSVAGNDNIDLKEKFRAIRFLCGDPLRRTSGSQRRPRSGCKWSYRSGPTVSATADRNLISQARCVAEEREKPAEVGRPSGPERSTPNGARHGCRLRRNNLLRLSVGFRKEACLAKAPISQNIGHRSAAESGDYTCTGWRRRRRRVSRWRFCRWRFDRRRGQRSYRRYRWRRGIAKCWRVCQVASTIRPPAFFGLANTYSIGLSLDCGRR
jgi:hypothetical protein